MNAIFEAIANSLKPLFESGGFFAASFMLIFLGGALCFVLMRGRCDNAFICLILRKNMGKAFEKKNNEEVMSILTRHGFVVMGFVYLGLLKILLGVIYGFVLRTEALSFLDFSFTTIPLREFAYKILIAPGTNKVKIIFFILLLDALQFIVNRSISMKTIVDTGVIDFITDLAIILACVFAPAGCLFYILILNIIECALTLLYFGPFAKRAAERVGKNMETFNKKFMRKAREAGQKKAEEKPAEQKKKTTPKRKRLN